MSEILQKPEKEITPETLPLLRKELAGLRETKGEDKKALAMARWLRGGAERLEAHEDVVDLYWEEYLIGKHIVMEARDKEGLWNLPRKAKGIAEGYLLMRGSAPKAQDYIDKHGVEKKRPRSGRFLGEIAMFERRYGRAIENFRHSIKLFEKMDQWQDRVNALELKGFLAEAMILKGEFETGVGLAGPSLSMTKGTELV
jgi:hypothetical protein